MHSLLVLATDVPLPSVAPIAGMEVGPDLVFIAKTFGLGVSVLLGWCGILLKEKAADKAEIRKLNETLLAEQKAYSAELKQLLKENLSSIPALIRIVESITPQVNAANDKVQTSFNASVESLKNSISGQLESLRQIVASLR